MGDFLTGKTTSGTPKETQGAAGAAGKGIQKQFEGGGDPFGGLRREAIIRSLGFDPSTLGLGGIFQDALGNPNDALAGFDKAQAPFQSRTVARGVDDLRGVFGSQGGRFGRNVATAEGQLRGEFADQFARERVAFRDQEVGRRNNALFALLSALGGANQGANNELSTLLGFLNPQSPNKQEGALGGIIQGAGRAAFG